MADTMNTSSADLRNEAGIEIERRTGPAQWDWWHQKIDEFLDWQTGTREQCNPNGHRSWRAAYQIARGQMWTEQIDGSSELNSNTDLIEDKVSVPHLALHIENLTSFLARNDPYFYARPRRPGDEGSAKVQEGALNYYWREQQYTAEFKKCLRDYCTIGHCVARTDWFSEREIHAQRPKGANSPTDTTQYDAYVRPEHPGFRRVNPFTFLLDRTTPTYDLRGARWCGEIMVKPVADVISNENYKKAVRDRIRRGEESPKTLSEHLTLYEGGLTRDTFFDTRGDSWVEDDQMIVLAEIWDKRFRQRRVFALGVQEPLIEEAWPYDYLDNFPYEMANFIPVPNEIYGIGHCHLAGQAQLLNNRLLTKLALKVRKHNAKYMVDGKLEPEEQQKWVRDEDGALIQIPKGTKLEPIQDANLSFDVLQALQIFREEMNQLTNTDALTRGGQLPSRTSAHEVDTRMQLHGMKLADHAATIDLFLVNIGRQLLKHIKQNLRSEVAIQIVGPKGREFVALRPEDTRADTDVDLESTTREVVTPQVERQQLMELLQVTVQMLPQLMQIQQMQQQQGVQVEPITLDVKELYRQALSKFDALDVDKIFPEGGAPLPQGELQPQASPQALGGPAPTEVDLAQSVRATANN